VIKYALIKRLPSKCGVSIPNGCRNSHSVDIGGGQNLFYVGDDVDSYKPRDFVSELNEWYRGSLSSGSTSDDGRSTGSLSSGRTVHAGRSVGGTHAVVAPSCSMLDARHDVMVAIQNWPQIESWHVGCSRQHHDTE
jgi:hypothetical protein